MKRSVEGQFLRLEYQASLLQKTATATQDSDSDTTTTTTTATIEPLIVPTENAKQQLLTTTLCDVFFQAACYNLVATGVFPEDILQDDAKRRFLCDAAYSAFGVLVCVEGVDKDVKISTLFSLLVWVTELSLAAFFDAKERTDVHSGHTRALRDVIKAVAYKAHSSSEPPGIQKAARALSRQFEQNDCKNTKQLEHDLFEGAKRVIASSTSVALVLKAGCRRGCFLFPIPQPQQPRHREIRVTGGRR